MSSPLHQYAIAASGIAVGSTAKTVLQLRGAAVRRGRVKEISGGFNGATAADGPALVEIIRQSTDGTMTGVTPAPTDPVMPAAQLSGAHTATAEPTFVGLIKAFYVPVQGGGFSIPVDYLEIITQALADSNVGIRITTPQAQTFAGSIIYEE